jgi:hypothetical protein
MPAKKVADTSKSLVTPMPGLVANLLVKVGDKVAPGQPLAVIEAMKMQNMLSVGKAFVVKSIMVKVGDNVAFKSDIEQWAKIIEIKKTYMGVALVLENKHGFQGEYIGGSTITTQLASDCWAD